MAYQKTEWKDRKVQNPRTYSVRDNEDGTITLLDVPGEITEAGTPVNAANMNNIENGIANSVQKTGDETISGIKNFEKIDTGDKPQIIISKNGVDNCMGILNTGSRFYIVPCSKDGVLTSARPLTIELDGSAITTVTPPDGDNSTKIATTAWVKANASSIVESGNNYIKFSDKTLICWVKDIGKTTWTFPKPFANTDYALISRHPVGHTKNTANIVITDMNQGFEWKPSTTDIIAIGKGA